MSSALDSLAVSLLIPRSRTLTSENKTGSWSFARPRYRGLTAPCSAACPCAQDIPRIEALASSGRVQEALRLILEENPLPGACGRVCYHPCEAECNRGKMDEAVSINALERFLSEASGIELEAPRAPKGRKIAIIGSGPAGLSASYFLARLGYACEIFESSPRAGGILRYGIPAYRLPEAALDRDIDRITSLGVALRLGREADRSLAEASAYAAVIIAAGKVRPLGLGIPGQELAQDALGLLRRIREGTEAPRPAAGGERPRAAVIGGGNTAIDAARSLLRLGYAPTIVYRRRREDMPAIEGEVGAALAEGVGLLELSAPSALEKAGGGFVLKLQKMRSGDLGADGRAKSLPVPGEGSELRVEAVYAAVGAEAAEGWREGPSGARRLKLKRCAIELGSGRAPLAYVGDLASGRETVSDAVASGKEAAIALDAYFALGEEAIASETARSCVGTEGSPSMEIYLGGERGSRSKELVSYSLINTAYFESSRRTQPASIPSSASASSFEEVEAGLGEEAAGFEAARCFSCGTCDDCDNCRTYCPEAAVRASPSSKREIDADYCKGCGLCATECPRGAIAMEEPKS
jgi:NADPH-dependent glutamate synthase beta subunit-like oxidoreductase